MKNFLIVPEKIVELLIKDNYIIFLTEVIDIKFLTPQYLPFLRPIQHIEPIERKSEW